MAWTLLMLLASLPAVPLWTLTAECLASMLPGRRLPRAGVLRRPRIDVLVPAHNEAGTLPATLPGLLEQLQEGDRLWVIADNCTDATAEQARACGANVLERHDPGRRGKGYALDFGLRAIERSLGDVVVVIDADCLAQPGAVERIAREALAWARPVQGSYLMQTPPQPGPRDRLSGLAVALKNLVRPLGLRRLGLPCLLTGSGMAFPRDCLRGRSLATGHLVEDMLVSTDLLIEGSEPRFCPEARFAALLPGRDAAARSQRTRWEHGHLLVILTQVPRLLKEAVFQRRPKLAAAAFDLAIPPLSLLGIATCLSLPVLLAAGLAGFGEAPAILLGISGAAAAAAVTAALARHLPGEASWQLWYAIPRYALAKVPIYAAFLFRRQRAWVRTGRDPLPRPDTAPPS